jgi:hypothetical protein
LNTEDLVRINQRLAAIEQKLDHLYAHLGVEAPASPAPSSNVSPAVMNAINEGNLIVAIKLYREETGSDLATAKATVEEIAGGGLIV